MMVAMIYVVVYLFILGSTPTILSMIIGGCQETPDYSRCSYSDDIISLDGICQRGNCIVPDPVKLSYTIAVNYASSQKNPDLAFWIRGTGPGLTWDKPVKMMIEELDDGWMYSTDDGEEHHLMDLLNGPTRIYYNRWLFHFEYTMDVFAVACIRPEHCVFNQNALEFRVYKDRIGSLDMIGPNYYYKLPIIDDDNGNTIEIYPYFKKPSILEYSQFETISFTTDFFFFKRYPPDLHSGVNINPSEITKDYSFDIIFPPSYHSDLLHIRTYPVVIVLTPSLKRTEAIKLASTYLYHTQAVESSVKEMIIVAVPAYNNQLSCSLSPYKSPYFVHNHGSTTDKTCTHCNDPLRLEPCEKATFQRDLRRCSGFFDCGYGGKDLLELLTKEVIPKIRSETKGQAQVNYPTDRLTIIGYKEGGLLACYAGLMKPEVFDNIGCLSATFHYGIDKITLEPRYDFLKEIEKIRSKIINYESLKHLYRTQKYYLDIGEKDSFFFPLYEDYATAMQVVTALQDTFGLRLDDSIFFNIIPNDSSYHNQYLYNQQQDPVPFFNRLLHPLLLFQPVAGGSNDKYPKLQSIKQFYFSDWEAFFEERLQEEDSVDLVIGEDEENEVPDEFENPEIQQCSDDFIRISLTMYLSCISGVVLLSVMGTSLLICIRETNKKTGEEVEELDMDEMLELMSSEDDS